MKILLLLIMLLISSTVYSCDYLGISGIMPKNDMYIPAGLGLYADMDEEKFLSIIEKVENVYAPIVEEMGDRLVIVKKWNDGTVNAYARRYGNTMEVNMFGGLARHQTITNDGFALVVCHELGHHLGGLPKKRSYFGTSWASNEGQSDYWGVMKCFRRVFIDENNVEVMQDRDVSATVVESCSQIWESANDQALCQRAALAGKSLGELFRGNGKAIDFDTPDQKVVTATNGNHPAAQCRLDTYFQASLCEKDYTEDIDYSFTDINMGQCARANDYELGVRPLCWYKP